MEQGPSGLNPELRTPPLPATHVRAGTGHRVLARNYTTDQGRPSYLRVHSPCATSCRNCCLVLFLLPPQTLRAEVSGPAFPRSMQQPQIRIASPSCRTVGWPGASQPPAPTEPCVMVSRHTALPIMSA